MEAISKTVKSAMSLVKKEEYPWKFSNMGGTTRVSIETGEDIAHLGELDQKMWTVLSCPVKGLEIDERTLTLMDADSDGKIRVNEIIATAKWLTTVLRDLEILIHPKEELSLSAINSDNEEGRKLLDSVHEVLSNLGLTKDSISLSDTADQLAIFAKTRFNGDGVITEQTCEEELLKNLVAACMKIEGASKDRSGDDGINADQLEAFFTHCQEYHDWFVSTEGRENDVFPYGDTTKEASAALDAIREKVEDFFLRCKFVSFDEDAVPVLDVPLARLEGVGEKNLQESLEEITQFPIARIRKDGMLPVASGINPAWEGVFADFKKRVLDVDFPESTEISESDWKQLVAKFTVYKEWLASKKGAEVESLDWDLICAAIDADNQQKLRALMDEDKSLEAQAKEIENVDKLLHLYRDFYVLLKNYITFTDFYTRDKGTKAIFQAGTLYIDQRSCDLCLKVTDMSKQNAMAPLSGMFLIYCDCTSKTKNEKMTIVAVMTDGDVNDLREGKNAVFYDRSGLDWDAVVTKIIDNPISVRQAFWSPYRKFGRFCTEQLNKFASEKENKVTGDMMSGATNASASLSTDAAAAANGQPAAPAAKPPFDMSKFLGLFAVIGMALGTICGFLLDLLKGFSSLKWYAMIGVIIGIILVISGPSMLIAWMKLRKRDLAPILNANGWAINAKALVNIIFGSTLTQVASFPNLALKDTMKRKGMPMWLRILLLILVAAVIAFAVLFFTNRLSCIGLRFR